MYAPFGHVVTAMVTPFDAKGAVAKDIVEDLVRHLLASGTDSILVGGTTGESPTLSEAELIDLVRLVRGLLKGDARLIVGTGTNGTDKSIALSRKVQDEGADGILVVNPYYNKPVQAGLEAHFRAVAGSVDIPVLLYNIPGRTGVNCNPETMAKLVDVTNIVGVKEAAGSVEQAAKIRRLLPEDRFAIYSGDDALTLPMLSVGAVGVVSVASHLVGERIGRMIKAFFAGDVRSATAVHLELIPLFEALFCRTNPIPIKYALNRIGINAGGHRLPLTPLDEEGRKIVDAALKQIGLIS
jgi:4-hydroxy-tetrahydrodipicolinate synthase